MQDLIIIAHRGASGYCVDNSYDSINKAIEMKSDIIEIDLRLTKDNVIVLSHDNQFTIDGENYNIDETEYVLLKNNIVQLDDLLDCNDNSVQFYLDIKCTIHNLEIFITKLQNLLEKYTHHFFYIASFCREFVETFHLNMTNYELGIIYEKIYVTHFETIQNKLKFLVVDVKQITTNQLELIQNVKIFAYTMNDVSVIKKYTPYLDGIITDYPDILLKSKNMDT